MSSSPIEVVWHASRADIERPTLDGRTEGDNHANSGLGLFCGAGPDSYLAGFGPHLFALTLAPNLRRLRWTITDLRTVGDRDAPRSWFEEKGRELAQSFDLIELEENNGIVSQVIVLNEQIITDVKRFTREEFLTTQAVAQPLPHMRPRP